MVLSKFKKLKHIWKVNKMIVIATIIGLSMFTIFPYFVFKLVKLQIPSETDTIIEVAEVVEQ